MIQPPPHVTVVGTQKLILLYICPLNWVGFLPCWSKCCVGTLGESVSSEDDEFQVLRALQNR
jgi:hypothetical protein